MFGWDSPCNFLKLSWSALAEVYAIRGHLYSIDDGSALLRILKADFHAIEARIISMCL